jgi:hypothetical protein
MTLCPLIPTDLENSEDLDSRRAIREQSVAMDSVELGTKNHCPEEDR